jgi:class 3 adenylate cyclase
MIEGGVDRRLAAILAADVVGYSRLMAADEEGTLARLRALRAERIDPTVAKHHGRIVKLMGDGALIEFASVVDAVRCAVDVQRGMAEHEADLPEDQRIRFRIGVNLGDVIIEGDDIYGDGVNVAARLEGLAEPGGIVISGPRPSGLTPGRKIPQRRESALRGGGTSRPALRNPSRMRSTNSVSGNQGLMYSRTFSRRSG